jgi:hypothetical protein
MEMTMRKSDKLLAAAVANLPTAIERLADTFARASDWRSADEWGWNHWDMIADGEAHFVDSHTKLNQIFVVRALQLLAALPPQERDKISLPGSRALAEMAREGNPQGVLHTLKSIEDNPARWHQVLSNDALQCVDILRERLDAVWSEQQALEEDRTREARLDKEKIEKFRAELTRYFHDSGRLRSIVRAKGAIELLLNDRNGVPSEVLSINQLDHKGAFIAQEEVDYAGWGRGYGQGMAQGEDEAVFAEMIKGASEQLLTNSGSVVAAVERAIESASLKDPIVLQSLIFDARYAEFEQNKFFTVKYSPVSMAQWRDFDAFMGHLVVGSRQVPVFDTFVRRKESQNKILVMDAQRFLRWRQYAPDVQSGENLGDDALLLIRVVDLNIDIQRRNEIIAQNPSWLADHKDPVAYLRGSVLVTVAEKFRIDILDPSAAICLTFPGRVEEYE